IGGSMRTHPIGHCLDEGWTQSVPSMCQCGLGRRINREYVIAVHPPGFDPESTGSVSDLRAALQADRLGDGPLVVLAEEQHRRLIASGEDQRFVDVALAGCPVPEVSHGNFFATIKFD